MSSVTNPTTNPTTPAATGTSNAATGSAATGAQAQSGLNSNYTDFLHLLTTQLQNQDPTAPADTNQITTEIAQLSQVQAQLNTNTLLQQLVTLMNSSQSNNAVSYIGKQVDATGNQTALSGGASTLVYNLPSGASSSTVTISDATGKVVFTGAGTTLSGRNQVQWNGVNSLNSSTQPDGTYTFSVAAKDANGAALTATTLTSGTVTAVDTQNGTSSLSLGKVSVPLNTVQSVYNPGTNAGA
jgi:flagellar basal-body rod modification protein FlgD